MMIEIDKSGPHPDPVLSRVPKCPSTPLFLRLDPKCQLIMRTGFVLLVKFFARCMVAYFHCTVRQRFADRLMGAPSITTCTFNL